MNQTDIPLNLVKSETPGRLGVFREIAGPGLMRKAEVDGFYKEKRMSKKFKVPGPEYMARKIMEICDTIGTAQIGNELNELEETLAGWGDIYVFDKKNKDEQLKAMENAHRFLLNRIHARINDLKKTLAEKPDFEKAETEEESTKKESRNIDSFFFKDGYHSPFCKQHGVMMTLGGSRIEEIIDGVPYTCFDCLYWGLLDETA